jgi:hypothetical protein
MRELLDHAAENDYGLPAFNVSNLEQVQAIMSAAAETASPVIMQASAGARKYAGEVFLRHLIEAAVESYPAIPIVMHQDHGQSPAVCASAMRLGFSSVMMDGSLREDGKSIADYAYHLDVTKKVVDAIAEGSGAFLHGFTYNAHPISLAAGRAVLHHLQEKKLVEAADSNRAGSPAAHFKQVLETLRAEESVGDVRGIGLLWAVEFVADKASKRPFPPEQNFAGRVGAAAMKRGLLVYPMQGSVDGVRGDHLLLAPPAIITGEQIAWSVEQLRASVQESLTSV